MWFKQTKNKGQRPITQQLCGLALTLFALASAAVFTAGLLGNSPSFAQAIKLPTDQAPLLSQSIREATDLVELRQFDRARVLIDKGLENNPRDPQWRFLEAMVLADTQSPEKAIAAFESLVDEFPELAEPYNNLAVLYLRLGQPERAQQALERAMTDVASATQALLPLAASGQLDSYLANANLYLELLGHTVVGWMWLKQAIVAQRALDNPTLSTDDQHFYRGKLMACQYFCNHELPKTRRLAKLLSALDDTTSTMRDEWF